MLKPITLCIPSCEGCDCGRVCSPLSILQALSSLHTISLDQCYRQVENLTTKLEGLKQRFGLSSTQRLVHSAQLEMEKVVRPLTADWKIIKMRSDPLVLSVTFMFQLLDSAVYTLELFLQSSAKLQPIQTPVKMERAKERVLKVKTRRHGRCYDLTRHITSHSQYFLVKKRYFHYLK